MREGWNGLDYLRCVRGRNIWIFACIIFESTFAMERYPYTRYQLVISSETLRRNRNPKNCLSFSENRLCSGKPSLWPKKNSVYLRISWGRVTLFLNRHCRYVVMVSLRTQYGLSSHLLVRYLPVLRGFQSDWTIGRSRHLLVRTIVWTSYRGCRWVVNKGPWWLQSSRGTVLSIV